MNENDPPVLPPASPDAEPDDFGAMMTGATVIFVIAFVPYAFVLCCLPQVLGALLALHLYTKKYQLTVSYGRGIKLGILTALLGSLAACVVTVALFMFLGYAPGAKEAQALLLKFAERSGPEMVSKMKEAFEAQKAHGLSAGQIFLQFVGAAIAGCISGLIGGSLGAALFKRGPKPR